MNIDITQIVVALIGLLGALITTFVIPWLKTKLDTEKQKKLEQLVNIGVYAAEQLFPGEKLGELKKKYVQDLLAKMGYDIDLQAVDAAIEAEVKKMNKKATEE